MLNKLATLSIRLYQLFISQLHLAAIALMGCRKGEKFFGDIIIHQTK